MKEELAIMGGAPLVQRKMHLNFPNVGEREIEAISEVIKESYLSVFTSEKVRQFENKFAEYIGSKNAIAVSSCTSALHAALVALGIGLGDEVILPAYTYIATANPIVLQKAKPVFADINPKTFTLMPEQVKKKISTKTKAIITVNLFGQGSDLNELSDIANDYDIPLIEDCAQSAGGEYAGKKLGTIGDVGCFSFHESKNMTTGEGGMLITNYSDLAYKVRLFINEGEAFADGAPALSLRGKLPMKYPMCGTNYRMSAIEAAIGEVQLMKLDNMNKKRRENARYLTKGIRALDLIIPPYEDPKSMHVFYVYVALLNGDVSPISRNALVLALNAEGIPAVRYFPTPLPAFQVFSDKKQVLHSKKATYVPKAIEDLYKNSIYVSRSHFALPVHSLMERDDLDLVLLAIEKIMRRVSK